MKCLYDDDVCIFMTLALAWRLVAPWAGKRISELVMVMDTWKMNQTILHNPFLCQRRIHSGEPNSGLLSVLQLPLFPPPSPSTMPLNAQSFTSHPPPPRIFEPPTFNPLNSSLNTTSSQPVKERARGGVGLPPLKSANLW